MSEYRYGNWMQAYGGGKCWPLDLHPEDITIIDIAHALGMLCRYNGHCKKFYSVAEHSVLVSRLVKSENALWGLLHDASEAYVADVPRPLKAYLKGYKNIEKRAHQAIAQKFGLPPEIPDEVKYYDNCILLDEKEQIMMPGPDWEPSPLIKPTGVQIECWSPSTAKANFLYRFHELTGDL